MDPRGILQEARGRLCLMLCCQHVMVHAFQECHSVIRRLSPFICALQENCPPLLSPYQVLTIPGRGTAFPTFSLRFGDPFSFALEVLRSQESSGLLPTPHPPPTFPPASPPMPCPTFTRERTQAISILINAQRVWDQGQPPFLIQTLHSGGRQRTYLNVRKAI